MNKKMVFGILLTFVGLVYSVSNYILAVIDPWRYGDFDGILGSLLAKDILIPFIIAIVVMCAGIVICFLEAYRKNK